MKAFYYKFIFTVFLAFCLQTTNAQDPNWSVNTSDYQFSMTLTSFLNVNSVTLTSSNDKVAAFVNGEIRGVANVIYQANANKYVAYLSVYANTNNETIRFKIYDSTSDTVLDIDKIETFIIDGNIGGISQSYSIASPELNDEAFFTSFSFLAITSVVENISSDKISIVLPKNTNLSNLTPVFTTSTGAKVYVNNLLQQSGSSSQNFNNLIIYKLFSANEAVINEYEVSVSVASTDNPTIAVISSTENLNTNLTPIPLEIVFVNNITGFDVSDFVLENAIISSFSKVDSKNYKAEIIPLSQGNVSVLIAEGAVLDQDNNQNQESNKIEFIYDVVKPIISNVSVTNDSNSWWFLVDFNEEVLNVDATDFELKGEASTGLTISDVSLISDNQYKVSISSSNSLIGVVTLQLKKNSDIKDLSINPIVLSEFEAYFLNNNNNNSPIADDENVSTDEDTLITIDVLDGDTDPENDKLTITEINGISIIEDQTLELTGGTVTLISAELVVTPSVNSTETIRFNYTVSDGSLTDSGDVIVTIIPINDAPIADDESMITPENTPITINVLDGDIDIDNDLLTISEINGTSIIEEQTIMVTGGTVTLTLAELVVMPDTNSTITIIFNYTVSDGELTDIGDVSVKIDSQNDAPKADDENVSTDEDTPITIDVLEGDTDSDNDVLTITEINGEAIIEGQTVTLTGGTVTLISAELVVTSTLNSTETITFTYTVSDGALTDTGDVIVTIIPINDAPIADDESMITPENTPITINVLDGDIDVDNDFLTISEINGTSIIEGQTITVIGGTVTLTSAELVVTPLLNTTETIIFNYTVTDGKLTDIGDVLVDITVVFSDNFHLSPNPMTSFFRIKIDIGVFEKIIIFDFNGKVVFIEDTNLPELLINVDHFSHGVYILKIISTEGTVIKKILKN